MEHLFRTLNCSQGSITPVVMTQQEGVKTWETCLGDFTCDYTLGCSFLRSTPTPCVVSTDVSVVWWWTKSGHRYNQKPLVWLVECLSPIHQLGTQPEQCQTWTATGDGGQGSAIAWAAEMFCCQMQQKWTCCRSLDVPSLMWLLVLAFLSHDPGWRPVFWLWLVGFAIRCGLQQVGCLAQPQLALTQSGAKGGAWLPVGSCGSWMRALLLAPFPRTISNISFIAHAGFCRAPSEDQVLSVISLAVQFIPRKRQIHCTGNCQLIFRCSHKCSGGNWINFLDSAFFQLCHTSSCGKSGCLCLNQATCASFD